MRCVASAAIYSHPVRILD